MQVGLIYLPELGGAVVMAVVFGIVISRRAMHYLPLVGMALLAAGSWCSGCRYRAISRWPCSARR